jgi:HlyD family secretion protein
MFRLTGSVSSLAAAAVAASALAGCARPPQPDAYGNVEVTGVVVGAESSGQLTSFVPDEGDTLAADAVVAIVDTTELALQREQFAAQQAATMTRVRELDEQTKVLEAQRDSVKAQQRALDAQQEIARRAYERTGRLIADRAATAQQLDQAEKDYRVLGEQIAAGEHQIVAQERQVAAMRAQQQSARQQTASARAQVAQIQERIQKAQVRNPVAGTVLATYAKAGEFVQTGQPLYKIASLDSVDVRAYVTEPQLALLRIGQQATVSFDVGKERQSIAGTISWVSSEAEFTPTPIQTRDERANLVYAVKIRVPNRGGILKIGMPADVQFSHQNVAS